MSKGFLYGPVDFYKSQRVQIIAKYAGKNIVLNNESVPESIVAPKGSIPVYSEGDVTLFETNAICYYLGNEQLRGNEDKASVSQWCNYADLVLLPAVGTLVFPCLGLMQFNKSENEKAKEVIATELKFLNDFLLKTTFLVGERITQADITVFSVLKMLFEMIYDEASRKPLNNLNRWLNTIANQDNVKSVVGEMKFCITPAQFDGKKYAELHPKKEVKEEKKVKEKKPQEKKQEKPKKEEEEDMDDEVKEVPQGPCPYSLLPKGTFDMEEWKRTYSNNDTVSVALPYFWSKFDPENYSIWTCEYLFPNELELVFMTCNLVSGMFQRLDRLRKHAFASMVILGKNHESQIKGLWVLKGQELAFTLHDDCKVDYESYKWEKLDPTSDKTKELVQNYFTHEGDFGMTFNQGKIFK